ncbi:glycosyltransferase family 1 protein [Candidatus Methylospira mobilis]|uniref:glycosyltransferase family 4 protein n=1 Tax=Candidatus Methylospira mobilis TaxID=1808979 RepID=UPI0028E9D58E|nr:glycosyltransferase family 1 protein [Candidatus Methylospira mobilis]WNV06101.1 glycosyltransferase family 1 protein [Candidatus Methylospira mobilis]
MKVILAVNAIKPPLTGIGRYNWELATRIPSIPGVEDVRFLRGGRGQWVKDIDALLRGSAIKIAARRSLLRSSTVVASYRILTTILLRQRLRPYADYIFHGPNFYLPQCSGPAIATIHDLSIFRYPQFHPPERVAFMEKEVAVSLERANFLITDSEFVRQEVIEFFGWPEHKVCSVPLGVTEDFHPRNREQTAEVMGRFGLEYGGYTFCVATIEPRKNIAALLSAYGELPEALRKRYPLVLAGDKGWLSKPIHRSIEQAQSEGWLRYLGFVPESDLPAIFSGARGFAYPSLYEGFGLPVLEAMASGIPALISNRSSLPEVAADAALIVEANDIREISDNLRILLEDEQWRNVAVKKSLEVASRYSWQSTAQKTVDVYRMVADGNFALGGSA